MRNACLKLDIDDDLEGSANTKTAEREERHGPPTLSKIKHVDEIARREQAGKLVLYDPRVPVSDLLKIDKLIIRRSWKSLPFHWLLIVLLSYGAIQLTEFYPRSVLCFSLDMFSSTLELNIPMFVIPLFLIMLHGFARVYDRHAILDPEYLVYYRGNLSIKREVCDMETASMQVVTVKQKPWEALLGVGNVSLGRFSRRGLEFDLYGVANPHRLARFLKISVLRARKNAGNLSDRLKSLEDEDDSDESLGSFL